MPRTLTARYDSTCAECLTGIIRDLDTIAIAHTGAVHERCYAKAAARPRETPLAVEAGRANPSRTMKYRAATRPDAILRKHRADAERDEREWLAQQ